MLHVRVHGLLAVLVTIGADHSWIAMDDATSHRQCLTFRHLCWLCLLIRYQCQSAVSADCHNSITLHIHRNFNLQIRVFTSTSVAVFNVYCSIN